MKLHDIVKVRLPEYGSKPHKNIQTMELKICQIERDSNGNDLYIGEHTDNINLYKSRCFKKENIIID